MYFLFYEPKILLSKKQNYIGRGRVSVLIIETKQRGPISTKISIYFQLVMLNFDHCDDFREYVFLKK